MTTDPAFDWQDEGRDEDNSEDRGDDEQDVG
jgi:hypothetical protein